MKFYKYKLLLAALLACPYIQSSSNSAVTIDSSGNATVVIPEELFNGLQIYAQEGSSSPTFTNIGQLKNVSGATDNFNKPWSGWFAYTAFISAVNDLKPGEAVTYSAQNGYLTNPSGGAIYSTPFLPKGYSLAKDSSGKYQLQYQLKGSSDWITVSFAETVQFQLKPTFAVADVQEVVPSSDTIANVSIELVFSNKDQASIPFESSVVDAINETLAGDAAKNINSSNVIIYAEVEEDDTTNNYELVLWVGDNSGKSILPNSSKKLSMTELMQSSSGGSNTTITTQGNALLSQEITYQTSNMKQAITAPATTCAFIATGSLYEVSPPPPPPGPTGSGGGSGAFG